MLIRRLLWPGLLLVPVASAAPYTQQTSFGTPSPLIQAAQAQTSVKATWGALPEPRGGRLESGVVEVAPFNELVPSWNVTGPGGSSLTLEVRVRRGDGRWTPYFGFGTWRAAGPRASQPVTRTADGTVNTDTLTLPYRAAAFQYRVTLGPGLQVSLMSLTRPTARSVSGTRAGPDRRAPGTGC